MEILIVTGWSMVEILLKNRTTVSEEKMKISDCDIIGKRHPSIIFLSCIEFLERKIAKCFLSVIWGIFHQFLDE